MVPSTLKVNDSGNDQYSDGDYGTFSLAADGTNTTSRYLQGSDSGTEDVHTLDSATVTAAETEDDGSVVTAADQIADRNDDSSQYRDGETEKGTFVTGGPSGGTGTGSTGTSGTPTGGTDVVFDGTEDTDTFLTSENEFVRVTSASPYGAAMTAILTDISGDGGRLMDMDYLRDNESLDAGMNDTGDNFTFQDGSDEQDDGSDMLRILAITHGLVGSGEELDSTEIVTLQDSTGPTK